MRVVREWVIAEGVLQRYSLFFFGRLVDQRFIAVFGLSHISLKDYPSVRVFFGNADGPLEETVVIRDHGWARDRTDYRMIDAEKGCFVYRKEGATFGDMPVETLSKPVFNKCASEKREAVETSFAGVPEANRNYY